MKRLKIHGMMGLMIVTLVAAGACSLKKMALNQVGNMLAAPGGGKVFSGDNDPELVGDALPFAVKMYESLADSMPWHQGMQIKTGSLYIMYANAFLQTPATMLSEAEYKKQEFLFKRAKNLYLRGRDILLRALDRKHKGFLTALHARQYDKALGKCTRRDIDLLYWAGAGWVAAFAIEPFDMDLGITLPQAAALMKKVESLDPSYGRGAIHDFYILYYGSLPEYMGGNSQKARDHYAAAIKMGESALGSVNLSLATTVSVKEQNLEEFKTLLSQVLKIDPDSDAENRLVNILNLRKANWLMEHLEDFFVETGKKDSQTGTIEETKEEE